MGPSLCKKNFGREPYVRNIKSHISASYNPTQTTTDALKNSLRSLPLRNSHFLDIFASIRQRLYTINCSEIRILKKERWFKNSDHEIEFDEEHLMLLTHFDGRHNVEYVFNPEMLLNNPNSNFLASLNDWRLNTSQGSPHFDFMSNPTYDTEEYDLPLIKGLVFANEFQYVIYQRSPGIKNPFKYKDDAVILCSSSWYEDFISSTPKQSFLAPRILIEAYDKNRQFILYRTPDLPPAQHLCIYVHCRIIDKEERSIHFPLNTEITRVRLLPLESQRRLSCVFKVGCGLFLFLRISNKSAN